MEEFSTEVITTEFDTPDFQAYGLGSYKFAFVHVTALVVLAISLFTSLYVIIYLLKPRWRQFFKWPIGDRLVVYLAFCDLAFSISHTMDHSYMMAVQGNPPDTPCAVFGFMLNEFVLAQSMIVFFTAFNAFVMVVLGKKIPTGRYDSGLLLYALGLPFAISVLAVSTRHLGPSGYWCYVDVRRPLGPLVTNMIAVIMLVAFVFNICCYLGIWFKIQGVAKKQGDGKNKYHRSANVMILFVAVYLVQWWAFVTFAVWLIFGQPHIALIWVTVVFSNSGGVFNAVVYTLIRRRAKKVDSTEKNTETTGVSK